MADLEALKARVQNEQIKADSWERLFKGLREKIGDVANEYKAT